MPRSLRMDHEGAWQHVMNRGAAHAAIFQDGRDHIDFLRELDNACAFAALELHAFCLMGNHYHLLLKSNEGRLSEGMQRLSSNFTHAMNQRHGRDGALFRGRFASREIMDNAQMLQALRSIHLNPTEARLVTRPEDWRW